MPSKCPKKRPATARRAPLKKRRANAYAPKVDSDSMNVLITSYFEAGTVQNADPNLALGGTFGYMYSLKLKCDPVGMAIRSAGDAATGAVVRIHNASNVVIAQGGLLSFDRLASFLTLHRQIIQTGQCEN